MLPPSFPVAIIGILFVAEIDTDQIFDNKSHAVELNDLLATLHPTHLQTRIRSTCRTLLLERNNLVRADRLVKHHVLFSIRFSTIQSPIRAVLDALNSWISELRVDTLQIQV